MPGFCLLAHLAVTRILNPAEAATNSLTLEGWRAWLAWAFEGKQLSRGRYMLVSYTCTRTQTWTSGSPVWLVHQRLDHHDSLLSPTAWALAIKPCAFETDVNATAYKYGLQYPKNCFYTIKVTTELSFNTDILLPKEQIWGKVNLHQALKNLTRSTAIIKNPAEKILQSTTFPELVKQNASHDAEH